MKIKWYGHACFRIEGDGVAVVTDPYTPEVAGLAPVDESADVVIMSSATDGFFRTLYQVQRKVLPLLSPS